MNNPKAIKVMIMAGGTGGHVFPALALAKELLKRKCAVEWLGTAIGIESKIVEANAIKLNTISISGVRGKGFVTLFSAPLKIVRAILEAKNILKTFKPDVVVGLGGYAAGPGGIAAWLMGIPLVIHEQNARAGTTNKYLAKFAKRVLCGFPTNLKKQECIGNPVRQEISSIAEPTSRFSNRTGKTRLLVLGGSLGALAINKLVPEALAKIDGVDGKVDVIHQCGERHVELTRQAYEPLSISVHVEPFITEMADVLAWADIVVCRAGALTVSEIASVGVASILIPFPYAIDDHQYFNALWLKEHGAAMIEREENLDAELLKTKIENLLNNPEELLTMAKAARQLAKPQATRSFADICMEVAYG